LGCHSAWCHGRDSVTPLRVRAPWSKYAATTGLSVTPARNQTGPRRATSDLTWGRRDPRGYSDAEDGSAFVGALLSGQSRLKVTNRVQEGKNRPRARRRRGRRASQGRSESLERAPGRPSAPAVPTVCPRPCLPARDRAAQCAPPAPT
jgi:hypothetical protein